MRCRLSRDYRFEAAHFLPRVPEGHKCRRMHGHSYAVRVTIEGPIDPDRGWLIDFASMDQVIGPILGRLDHQVLNQVADLYNPTAENLAMWLWREIGVRLPVAEIEVAETPDSRCAVRGA